MLQMLPTPIRYTLASVVRDPGVRTRRCRDLLNSRCRRCARLRHGHFLRISVSYQGREVRWRWKLASRETHCLIRGQTPSRAHTFPGHLALQERPVAHEAPDVNFETSFSETSTGCTEDGGNNTWTQSMQSVESPGECREESRDRWRVLERPGGRGGGGVVRGVLEESPGEQGRRGVWRGNCGGFWEPWQGGEGSGRVVERRGLRFTGTPRAAFCAVPNASREANGWNKYRTTEKSIACLKNCS